MNSDILGSLKEYLEFNGRYNNNQKIWLTEEDIKNSDVIEAIIKYKYDRTILDDRKECVKSRKCIQPEDKVVLKEGNVEIDDEKKLIDLSQQSFIHNYELNSIIKAITARDSTMIVIELQKLKQSIKKKRAQLNEIIKKYEGSLVTYNAYLTQHVEGDLVFDNTYVVQDNSNELLELRNILQTLERVADFLHKRKSESTLNVEKEKTKAKKYLKYEKEFEQFVPQLEKGQNEVKYLAASVNSGLSWRYLNCAHHAIGSSLNITHLVMGLLYSLNTRRDRQPELFIATKSHSLETEKDRVTYVGELGEKGMDPYFSYLDLSFIRNIFSQYTQNDALIHNMNDIFRQTITMKDVTSSLLNPVESRKLGKVIPFSDTLESLDLDLANFESIHSQKLNKKMLSWYITEALGEPYNRFNGEFLITLLYLIFKKTKDFISHLVDGLEKIMLIEKKYDNVDFIIANMRKSVKDLHIIILDRIKTFFGIECDGNIIDEADTSLIPKVIIGGHSKKILRLMCSFDRVIKKENLNRDKYPLVSIIEKEKELKFHSTKEYEENARLITNDIVKKLHMFIAGETTHSIGGLIQFSTHDENISMNSFNMIIKYYTNINDKQARALRYIEKIFAKMTTGIHKNILFVQSSKLWEMYKSLEKNLKSCESGGIFKTSKNKETLKACRVKRAQVMNVALGELRDDYRKMKSNVYNSAIDLFVNEKVLGLIRQQIKTDKWLIKPYEEYQEKLQVSKVLNNYYKLYRIAYQNLAIILGNKYGTGGYKDDLTKMDSAVDKDFMKYLHKTFDKIDTEYEIKTKREFEHTVQEKVMKQFIELMKTKPNGKGGKRGGCPQSPEFYIPFVDSETNVVALYNIITNEVIFPPHTLNGNVLIGKTKDEMENRKRMRVISNDTVNFLRGVENDDERNEIAFNVATNRNKLYEKMTTPLNQKPMYQNVTSTDEMREMFL